MAVGTDFLTFATGAGANIEDQPSYITDPLRQTGNLPGIARSNFNNKGLRQGTFVACAISTFITQELNIFVPDDGDVQKYVDYFKQAINTLFTGSLPGEPDLSIYVRKAGDTMTGDLQFVPGASIQMANNTWLRGKNTSGTPLNVLIMGSDNNIKISDGSTSYTYFGNTPVVANNRYWSCQDTTAAVRNILGIAGDNNTYINSYNQLFINSATTWFNSNVVVPNNSWYYSKNAAGASVHLLGVNTANDTYVGAGAPRDTYIMAASGRTIYMQNNVQTAGGIYVPYISNGGNSDFWGTVVAHGALSVYGGTNMYQHLWVNNGAGADISGTLNTNTLHCISAHAYVDGNVYTWDMYAGGSIFAGGLQAFNSGGWFYFVNGVHTADLYSRNTIYAAGRIDSNYIHSYGSIDAGANVSGNWVYGNGIRSWGSLYADGHLFVQGLEFGNSDGYWHTPNGIAVDSRAWLRGGCLFVGQVEHYSGNHITNGNSFYQNGAGVFPYGYGEGVVGNSDHPWAWIVGFNITSPSDARDKTNITPIERGCLALVNKIVPQSYNVVARPNNYTITPPYEPSAGGEPSEVVPDTELAYQLMEENKKIKTSIAKVMERKQWGFIAQDVGRVMKEAGVDFGGHIVSERGNESLALFDMIAVLWAAVRELSDEVTKLKTA